MIRDQTDKRALKTRLLSASCKTQLSDLSRLLSNGSPHGVPSVVCSGSALTLDVATMSQLHVDMMC